MGRGECALELLCGGGRVVLVLQFVLCGNLLSPQQHLPEGSGFGSVIQQYQLSNDW